MMEYADTILFIDDDSFNNLLAKRLFKKLNVSSVFFVENGEEALIWYNQNGRKLPQCVFLDINMPLMNGIEFLEMLIKENNDFTNTKVIVMLSSDFDTVHLAPPLLKVIHSFIDRPLTAENIVSHINSIK